MQLTENIKKEIKELYLTGLSANNVSRALSKKYSYKISEAIVFRELKKMQVPIRKSMIERWKK